MKGIITNFKWIINSGYKSSSHSSYAHSYMRYLSLYEWKSVLYTVYMAYGVWNYQVILPFNNSNPNYNNNNIWYVLFATLSCPLAFAFNLPFWVPWCCFSDSLFVSFLLHLAHGFVMLFFIVRCLVCSLP